jgi:short-subunit dehydrogenase
MPVTQLVDESEESIRRQVDINLHGVIAGTQMAIERMGPRRRGHIVNIASQAGKGGLPGIATYAATKHAVVGLTESVRWELRGSGIDLSCVMPTVVNTELTSGVSQRWVKPVEADDVAEAIVEALETNRYDVWVPKENGAIYKVIGLLPRTWREAIGRLMKVDKLMTEVDHGVRNAYEERVAQAEPATATGSDDTPREAQREAA